MMSRELLTNLDRCQKTFTGLDIKSLNKVIKQKGYTEDDKVVKSSLDARRKASSAARSLTSRSSTLKQRESLYNTSTMNCCKKLMSYMC